MAAKERGVLERLHRLRDQPIKHSTVSTRSVKFLATGR
jgi:hypothetical protein